MPQTRLQVRKSGIMMADQENQVFQTPPKRTAPKNLSPGQKS